MTGGLLNLTAIGNQNVFLTGNPKKTFFKTTYCHYTNFGKQKFRIDYEGSKTINLNEKTHYDFKIPRNADLLMDTFLAIRIPNIWSTICYNDTCEKWIPYSFQWIENLGTQMIEEVRFTVGGTTLQRVSGQYLTTLVQREFTNTKKDLYNKMTGNLSELNNPSKFIEETRGIYPADCQSYIEDPNGTFNWYRKGDHYPHVIRFDESGASPNVQKPITEPSIRGRYLYIPMNIWYMLTSKVAFPLVALQYNELHIHVSLRPVREWFTINNVSTTTESGCKSLGQRIQPNFADPKHAFYRFIHPTPQIECSKEPIQRSYDERAIQQNYDERAIQQNYDERAIQQNSNDIYIQKITTSNNLLIRYADLNERLLGTKNLSTSLMDYITYYSVFLNYNLAAPSDETIKNGALIILNGLLQNNGDYDDEEIKDFAEFENTNYFIYFKSILFDSVMKINEPLLSDIIKGLDVSSVDYLSLLSSYNDKLDDVEKKMDLLELFIKILIDTSKTIEYTEIVEITESTQNKDASQTDTQKHIGLSIQDAVNQLVLIHQGLSNFDFSLESTYDLDTDKNLVNKLQNDLSNYIYQYKINAEPAPTNQPELQVNLTPPLKPTSGLSSEDLAALRSKYDEQLKLLIEQTTAGALEEGDLKDYPLLEEEEEKEEEEKEEKQEEEEEKEEKEEEEEKQEEEKQEEEKQEEDENDNYIAFSTNDLIWEDTRTTWDSDVHLMCTYVFLSDDERRSFAKNEQTYLFKGIHEYKFYGLHESDIVKLDALGMVSNYTFFFRRSDAYKRNEWSNYSNYEFNQVNPFTQGVITAPFFAERGDASGAFDKFFYTPSSNEKYEKNILQTFAILLDGKYRETEQTEGIYNYLDKYLQTAGNSPDGLYVYNFCLNSDPFTYQPSGALNMSKFKDIQFEFTILRPPVNPSAQVLNICDPVSGELVGVQETQNSIFEYTYDLYVFEERFNSVIFSNGNCGLLYAR